MNKFIHQSANQLKALSLQIWTVSFDW